MSRGHGGYASQNACATLAKAEELTHDSAHFFVSQRKLTAESCRIQMEIKDSTAIMNPYEPIWIHMNSIEYLSVLKDSKDSKIKTTAISRVKGLGSHHESTSETAKMKSRNLQLEHCDIAIKWLL